MVVIRIYVNRPDECNIKPEELTSKVLGGNGSKNTLPSGENRSSNCGVAYNLNGDSCKSASLCLIAASARSCVAGSDDTKRCFAPVFFNRCTIASGAFLGEIRSTVKPARRLPITEHTKVIVSTASQRQQVFAAKNGRPYRESPRSL